MYEISLTGILLCYGPLALTIIGFIAFAALTDADARRTYLRRLDLRPESEQPEVQPPLITQRTVAQTPAGMRVTLVPDGNGGGSGVVVAPPAGKPAPSAPSSDDLTRIEGIGPKMAAALQAAGLNTFAKIAAANEAQLKAAIEAAGMSLSPRLPSWPQQAKLAAAGKWDELKRLQDELGRKA